MPFATTVTTTVSSSLICASHGVQDFGLAVYLRVSMQQEVRRTPPPPAPVNSTVGGCETIRARRRARGYRVKPSLEIS